MAPNTIEIDGTIYLLSGISTSNLAAEAQPGETAVPAIPSCRIDEDEAWQSSYDLPSLTAKRGTPRPCVVGSAPPFGYPSWHAGGRSTRQDFALGQHGVRRPDHTDG